MKGQWIRTTKNGLNFVFIHGINSGEECWRHKDGSYWPDLLKDESELADTGIYLFSYRTGINTGSYSLSDIVDSLREYFKLDNLIGSSGIIFVCHSMGGIVTRRFIVNQQSLLIERDINKIGLFLVASPSLGSGYANMVNLISSVMGHTQVSALEFSQNNVWLNDLDKDFINLQTNKNLQIKGKELIEDLPLRGKGFIRKQIVEPFSGAKYFGNSFKVPGSDHITIATPTNKNAVQHRLLVQFAKEFIEEFKPLISHKKYKENIDDSLSSSRNIDYSKLQHLLQERQWQAADEETVALMLEVVGRRRDDWLRATDLKNFPLVDLRTVDQLWVKYSQNRFGFSIQRRVWKSLGSKTDWQAECAMSEQVGWQDKGKWIKYESLDFSLGAPEGHLPAVNGWIGGRGWNERCALLSRSDFDSWAGTG